MAIWGYARSGIRCHRTTREQLRWFAARSNAHRSELFRYCFWLTLDGTLAEAITRQTLLSASRSIGSLTDTSDVRQWLLRIARKKSSVTLGYGLDANRVSNPDPLAARAADGECKDKTYVAICGLPILQRESLFLSVSTGCSIEEIALHTVSSKKAVRELLCKARLELYRRLHGGSPTQPDSEAEL